jgi:hypothetical protein
VEKRMVGTTGGEVTSSRLYLARWKYYVLSDRTIEQHAHEESKILQSDFYVEARAG